MTKEVSRGTGPVSLDSESMSICAVSLDFESRDMGLYLRVGYSYKIPTICSNSYFTILRQNKCCSFLSISVTILNKGLKISSE